MNPNDIQPSSQPPRWPNQPENKPQDSNRYAWQQHLGIQDPDTQIIPNPGSARQQPFQNWPQTGQPPQPQPQPRPQLPAQPRFQAPPQLPPQPQPVQPQPIAPAGPPLRPPVRRSGKKKWIALLILLLLAAGTVYWFVLKPDNTTTKKPTNTTTTNSSAASDAAEESSAPIQDTTAELSTLQSATFNAPSNMDAYDVLARAEAFIRYTNKTNKRCELGLGTLTENELSGKDLDDIIAIQLKALRDSGATVSEPVAGTALALSDNTTPTKKYNMPTLKFELTKENVKAKSRYSAVVLKDGKRAVVNRTCYTEDGSTVDEAGMEALDASAQQITVTAQ
jgi:hypothetical protein